MSPEAAPASVFALFERSVERNPERPMFCAPRHPGRDYHPDGIELSYEQVHAAASRLRERYAEAGYRHGHRVALLVEQRPEFFFHYLALNALGCGIVPINSDYRHDELLYLLSHSEADFAVVLESRLPDVARAAAGRDTPLPVVPLESFPDDLPPPSRKGDGGRPGPDSECSLLYTSGTTGPPKGCVLGNAYYLNAGDWYCRLGGRARLDEGERILNPLPLFHMNAQAVTATAAIRLGGCLIAPDRFHPRTWWRDVVETRATVVHYLGVIPPLLMNQPEVPEERTHRVRFGLGAGVDPEIHAAFEARFGFPLVEVWGMTETGRIYADCHEPRQVHTRAFGRPLPGFEARVVDDLGREVPALDEGELVVRHRADDPRRHFFSGYLKNPQATEEAWRGGWFHTGDTVRQSEDGMLYFVDRKKNIIRRSGENIAASEVEACLQAHPDVAQAAVVPVADGLREEEVLACVVLMPDRSAGEDRAGALFDWCFERLAYFKAPGWLLFVDALPTTGTQKVQKHQLFATGEDPRERAGIHDFRRRKKRDRAPASSGPGA